MDELRAYAEEVGLWASRQGASPAYGKLLGWLLICDPPQQTSAELAAALEMSNGSISTNMRMLERSGLARRVAIKGHRGHAYEMSPDAMLRGTADAIPHWRAMAGLMRRGIDLVGADSPIEFAPRPVDDPAVRRPDTSLAWQRLRWRAAVPLEEGLRRSIAWFSAEFQVAQSAAGS